ncbi:ABC transporter substrate-binding protein [Paenibacillus thalictri]|nr:ABC transporter substrate-binding protein [Paenibacillus thalictri]
MRKVLSAAVFTMVLGSLVLSACSGGDGPSAKPPEAGKGGSSAKPVTLRMSWWGGETRHKATLKAIELYQSQHPNVKIEGEYGGFDGYLEKLTTQLAGRTAPDIIQIDIAYLGPFFKQTDLFVDFYTNKLVDLNGFDPNFLKSLSSPNGKLIGLPTGMNASSFYINKTLADQAGVDYSKQLTWDRLIEEGRKLQSKDKNMYLLNAPTGDIAPFIFEPYLFNLTGKGLINDDYTIGFDKDSLVKAFQYVSSLYENNVIQPVADMVTVKSIWENPKWINNQAVGALNWSTNYSPIKTAVPGKELITVEYPSTKGVKNTGINVRPTNMLAVNANSKSVEESAKFVNWFLNDPEAVKILGLERSIPAVESARKVLLDTNAIDKPFDNAVQYALKNQGILQNAISQNGEIVKIETDTLSKVAYKALTPDKAAEEMIKATNAKLEELKKKDNVK